MNIPAITKEQMAEVDRLAIERGLQIRQMMEHAGLHLARVAFDNREGDAPAVVLCGRGNNGADGIAAARFLSNWGLEVEIVLATPEEKLNEHGQHHLAMAKQIGCAVHEKSETEKPSVVVDALLGYSIEGDPRGSFVELIEWANVKSAPVVSCDNPSGLEVTQGKIGNPTVKATHTVTLGLPKTGLQRPEAAEYVGTLWLADLGIPDFIYMELGIPVSHVFEKGSIVKM